MTISIIGAGLSGLIAANLLARDQPQIFEAQPSLPNNHSAVLRFATSKVADATGITFRRVKMIKTYAPWRNRVADNLSYSRKCSGISRSDRSIAADVFSAERFIAPEDFIARLADGAAINFNSDWSFTDPRSQSPLISTIPMPALMKVLDYPQAPEFRYVHGAVIRAQVKDCDAYVSLYIPDPQHFFNRISITGDELIIEYAFPRASDRDRFTNIANTTPALIKEVKSAAQFLGLELQHITGALAREQKYAKIQPIDDRERKNFLAWATDKFNIYSLGRFATWRPQLLLDDLPQDIQRIRGWIKDGAYNRRFAR